MLVNALVNTIVVGIDLRRDGVPHARWEPAVWEFSSAVVLLALLPAVLAVERRFPLGRETWRASLPWHVLASIVFCALHIAGMVAIRKLVYAGMGARYAFDDWPAQFFYEYLKDARTYALFIVAVLFYRLALLRLQGEVRVLDAPDHAPEGPPGEPVDRPKRFLVRKLRKEFLIAADEIEWVQASGNYVSLHVGGHEYLLRGTIRGFEQRLDPQRFQRVHRSYIVNLDRIESIEPLDTGDARVHLRGGGTIPCSRSHREALKR